MKKNLSLILVVVLVFSLVACGNNENNDSTANTNEVMENTQSTENTEITDDGEDETIGNTEVTTPENTTEEEIKNETTDEKEDSVKPTESTKPTETKKPVETTKPVEHTHNYNYSSKITQKATCTNSGIKTMFCSCGESRNEDIPSTGHSWGEWKIVKEPTATTEGKSQKSCSTCGAIESKVIPKKESGTNAYYTGYQEVKKDYAYQTFVDGKHIVERLYNSKTIQTGDKVTLKINMSDGGSDFKVNRTFGGKVEKSGNQVVMTADGSDTEIGFWLEAKNADGTVEQKLISYSVLQYNFDIIQNQPTTKVEIREYARRRGLVFYSGTELSGYTKGKEDKSLTNCKREESDDYIPIKANVVDGKYNFENVNWVSEVLYLIEQYQKMGFTKWSFQLIYMDGFDTIAE